MVLVLKEGATKKEIKAINKILFKGQSSGGFNAKKYNGIMKLNAIPMAIQESLRNEWERI